MDQYAVVGNPITHSKSPSIHKMFAQQTGQELEYHALLFPEDKFVESLKSLSDQGFKGVNVTVPFKEDAFKIVDEMSGRAHRAGAVNTLVIHSDKVQGDNTDGDGLVTDLTVNLSQDLKDKRILLLGAGGACRGVMEPILQQRPADVVIANRTVSKAENLADLFSDIGAVQGCGFEEVKGAFDLVINGTSASLSGQLPPIPGSVFASGGAAYDMMYGAVPTVFLQWAKEQGCQQCFDGLGMLVEQAAESFYIWRGVRPKTQSVIAELRAQLLAASES